MNGLEAAPRQSGVTAGATWQDYGAGAPPPTLHFGSDCKLFKDIRALFSLARSLHNISRMDRLAAIAASGLRSRMESLEMLANNVANASTGGYKADKEFYSLYVAPEASEDQTPTTMPVVEKPWIDLSQGTLRLPAHSSTWRFQARVSSPSTVRTRRFTRVTAPFISHPTANWSPPTVMRVLCAAGTPLTLSSTSPVDITPDGSVSQNGIAIDRIAVVDFADPDAISKQGSNYFRAVDPTAARRRFQERRSNKEGWKPQTQGPRFGCAADLGDAAVRDVAEGGWHGRRDGPPSDRTSGQGGFLIKE